MDNNEKLEVIKKKVQEGLYISRIPPKVKARFKELAKEDFEGDYGFLIKFLLDFYDGLISSPNKMLLEQMELMAQEIESLKSVPKEEPKKKVIRSLSGRVIAEKMEE